MAALTQMRNWSARRWIVACVVALATVAIVAIPTDMLPNSWFTRSMPVTWWSYPVLVITAILTGMLTATYVATPATAPTATSPATKLGSVGVFATYFAVGCPVCNKIVVLALGVSGAMAWFAPLQPLLAVSSVVILTWALRSRLRGLQQCALPPVEVARHVPPKSASSTPESGSSTLP